MPRRLALLCLSLIIYSESIYAQSASYQELRRLSAQDLVFRQLQDSIALGYQAQKSGNPYPDLFICFFVASEGDDLFSVAARLSLPYETLSTLNGLEKPRYFRRGETVLVPSIAGVFVPEAPRNDMDLILASRARGADSAVSRVAVRGKEGIRHFSFYPGERLYPTERSFFLEAGFRMPLPDGTLTSRYGWRRSPIDGHDRMHDGVDLAAAEGSPVLAARGGKVKAVADDPALGLYLVIEHEGGLSTLYGHLKRTSVVLNEVVRSGTMIGEVGSSGLSTGPHLHFEIRLSGETRDPSTYVPGLKR